MKLTETRYRCDWCNHKQDHYLIRGSKWRGHIVCKKCGRFISQK